MLSARKCIFLPLLCWLCSSREMLVMRFDGFIHWVNWALNTTIHELSSSGGLRGWNYEDFFLTTPSELQTKCDCKSLVSNALLGTMNSLPALFKKFSSNKQDRVVDTRDAHDMSEFWTLFFVIFSLSPETREVEISTSLRFRELTDVHLYAKTNFFKMQDSLSYQQIFEMAMANFLCFVLCTRWPRRYLIEN